MSTLGASLLFEGGYKMPSMKGVKDYVSDDMEVVSSEDRSAAQLSSNLSSGVLYDCVTVSSDSVSESLELSINTSDKNLVSDKDHCVKKPQSNRSDKVVLPSRPSYDYLELSSDAKCKSSELLSSTRYKDESVSHSKMQRGTVHKNPEPQSVCESKIESQQFSSDSEQIPTSVGNSSCCFLQSEPLQDGNGFPPSFQDLVTVGSYIPVGNNFVPKCGFSILEAPSLVTPFLYKEPDKFPSREKGPKAKDFFSSAAGDLLISLGHSRVCEWYHGDSIRTKTHQIKKGESLHLQEELEMHKKRYAQAKKANEPFALPSKSCNMCSFVTESAAVLEDHRLTVHLTGEGEYRCSFCTHVSPDSRDVLLHMQIVHGKIGRLEPSARSYKCSTCTYETDLWRGFMNHKAWCRRRFNISTNLAPHPNYDFPGVTAMPSVIAALQISEKSTGCREVRRKRPRKTDGTQLTLEQMPRYLSNNRGSFNQNVSLQRSFEDRPANLNTRMDQTSSKSSKNQTSPKHYSEVQPSKPQPTIHVAVKTAVSKKVRTAKRRKVTRVSDTPKVRSISQSIASERCGSQPHDSGRKNVQEMGGLSSPARQIGRALELPRNNNQKVALPAVEPLRGKSPFRVQNSRAPDISISHDYAGDEQKTNLKVHEIRCSLTSPPQEIQGLQSSETSSGTEDRSKRLACEICDVTSKDRKQLRTHMTLTHNVKIHQTMGQPFLTCKMCDWLFYTDEGLERHLLIMHRLVTSHMEELVGKQQDGGYCTLCGVLFVNNLVAHINVFHRVTLKSGRLFYNCIICAAKFNLYGLFENHARLMHREALKRPPDSQDILPRNNIAKLSGANNEFVSNVQMSVS